jgi:hypothetical protein
MTGPIRLAGSQASPTVSESTASRSWSWNRRDVATEPTRIAREAAEHFWPAWPKADATTSRAARSRSALGVTTIAFFPLVSAKSRSPGRSERNA